MARLAIALVLLGLACAFAAPTFNELTYNSASTGTLLPVLNSYMGGRSLDYYRIWIPENILSLNVELLGTTDCYVEMYVSSRSVGCGDEWSEGTGENFPCRSTVTEYASSSSDDLDVFPYNIDYTYFALNAYLYVSVGRYYASDYDVACLYTLTPTATFCAAGEVASTTDTGYSTATCFAVNAIASLPFSGTLTTDGGWSFHRFWLDQATSVQFWGNSSDVAGYIYGQSNRAPSYYYANCEDSYSYDADFYIYSVDCAAEKGWFYFGFDSNADSGNVEVMITAAMCPAGWTGFNCQWPIVNLTGVALAGQSYGLDAMASEYPYQYFVFSYANGTEAELNVTFTQTVPAASSSDAQVFYRRGGFPVSDSDVYISSDNYFTLSNTGAQFNLAWQSLWTGGDHYFGVELYTYTTNVNFTLTTSAASTTSASGSATDSATTDGATTGSGAEHIVASFALIAFLFALLF